MKALKPRLNLLFLLPVALLGADDLQMLLESYEAESALHKKTKVESAGHLVVYTRDELDKMQAYTLKDILKSLRNFTLQENSMGNIELQRMGAYCANAGCIRLYVNDQELSSALSGSALNIFGEYDLSHIDHIEIYLGGNAISFGNEYGFVTIKMYTKEPSREKGSMIGGSYGSHGSYGVRALTAGTRDDIDYLLYATKNASGLGKLTHDGAVLPRESENLNLYGMIKRENDFKIEVTQYRHDHDALAGFGDQKTPQVSRMGSRYRYLQLTKSIGDVAAGASYTEENLNYTNRDANGITFHNGEVVNALRYAYDNKIFKLNLQHHFAYDAHNVIYGAEYQRKEVALEDFYTDNPLVTQYYTGPDRFDIYSAFLEYGYNFTDTTRLLVTGKAERYRHAPNETSDDITQFRVGLVSLLSDHLTFKAFFADNYIYPAIFEFADFPRTVEGNPNLDPMDVHNYSTELVYKEGRHHFGAGLSRMVIRDPIKVNGSKQYFNKEVYAVFNDYFVNYTYQYSKEHKAVLEYSGTSHNRPSDQSPSAGGHIKLFNTYEDLGIYNELIYRKGYYHSKYAMQVDNGYDWTMALTYQVNKNMTLSLRGENLLDKAIKAPIPGMYPVSTIERRLFLHGEWFF